MVNKYERAKEKDELTIKADMLAPLYHDRHKWVSGLRLRQTVDPAQNQQRLARGSSNDSPRSVSTGSAPRRVNDDTRDSVNDADDDTAHPNDTLYTSPPDSPTRSPSKFLSQAPPRAPEPSPSATTEGPPLRRLTRESQPPLRYKP
uniref:Uncharacterized protein n=1 Tax=Plectus sambesii TaxID=2011161 RepID=A0A914VMC9_9BILA